MGDPATPLGHRRDQVGPWTVHARVAPAPPPGAPVVVLVHGLVISSLYMVPTAVRLASDGRVFAPDLPGFGLSDPPAHTLDIPELADALAGWLAALGLEKAVLVGNSLGCQVAVDVAVRHPERVARLVLAGPTMDPHARAAGTQFVRWLRDWPRERPSLAPLHVRDYWKAGARRAWRTFQHALADPVEDKLPHVAVPTLVVRGGRDPIVPQRWAEEAATLLPRGRLAVIPDGPHVVNYTTPDAFVRLVRGFLP